MATVQFETVDLLKATMTGMPSTVSMASELSDTSAMRATRFRPPVQPTNLSIWCVRATMVPVLSRMALIQPAARRCWTSSRTGAG